MNIASNAPFSRVRDRLGLGYLILVALIMLGIATYRPHRHYSIFTHAAADLFSGQNPYGKAYDNLGVMSFWLYSPTASFLYKPLSLLPPHVGNFIYLSLSILLFFGGVYFFLKTLGLRMSAGLGLFYFILSNELIGAINNSKLELATTGFIFVIGGLVLSGRALLAGVILGVITNWKFQPLPTALLLLWALLWEKRLRETISLATGFLLAWAAAYGLPFLFFPNAFISDCYRVWKESLDLALSTTWQIYQSLYTSLFKITGWPISIAEVTTIGIVAGAALAALLPFGVRSEKTHDPFGGRPLLLTALSLGSVYSVLFSPMSQSSAYILGTPFLLTLFIIRNSKRSFIPEGVWTLGFVAHWIMTSYFYCDLALPSWRGLAGRMNLKPLGFSLLLVLFVIELISPYFRSSMFGLTRRPAIS